MRILHLSDIRNCHHRLRDLPEADVVVHSGDFCMVRTEKEALDFLNWFCDLPYKHKIFICGNHDDCLYGANIEGPNPNVHFLCNSGIEIDGIKIYTTRFLSNKRMIGQVDIGKPWNTRRVRQILKFSHFNFLISECRSPKVGREYRHKNMV